MKKILKTAETTQFRKNLLEWFRKSYRKLPWRETNNPYFIWISEVMLQQTQVNTVIPYYQRFISIFPDVETLAAANLQQVLKVWEGLGYYARARNLHRAARQLVKEGNRGIPEHYDAFRKLPGVGEYIAAAVQSIAFNKPFAVVDGNVKRVLARIFLINEPVNGNGSIKTFSKRAIQLLDTITPGMFNQAMMELGALICSPQNPLCNECPVKEFCVSFEKSLQTKYPRRMKKKQIPLYKISTAVIFKEGRILITKRAETGLLGGLWEFPGGKVMSGETSGEACEREISEEVNLKIKIVAKLATVKHAYTHFRIVMDVFICQHLSGKVSLNGAVDYRWIHPEEIDSYPFPKANHKFIPLLKSYFKEISG